ncbi:MAG: adenylyltransferase/cytidyltransferase family protein [Helicobacter sp.]|nr:adenylyltransferase/cytidyltransferase family protein [Helicobacter sp.]
MRRVIAFGTFDLFHYGHLQILRRAKEIGDFLIVGISSDSLIFSKKGRYPI